jgi:tryptophan synthase alpha chain
LVAPTTSDERIAKIVQSATGFIYYVAVSGVTGTKSASTDSITQAVAKIKRHTNIPVAVGFGIKTASDVKSIAQIADAVVVGSKIVQELAVSLDNAVKFVREASLGV